MRHLYIYIYVYGPKIVMDKDKGRYKMWRHFMESYDANWTEKSKTEFQELTLAKKTNRIFNFLSKISISSSSSSSLKLRIQLQIY